MMLRSVKAIVTLIASLLISACDSNDSTSKVEDISTIEWTLVTSWPKGFPGLGEAPENFAKKVNILSQGRLRIKVYGAGEQVPSFDVFNAVSKGSVQMGHSAAYYWQKKIPAAPFFASIPFGMTAQEMNAWLHYGGGLELWQELYAPFGVVPLAGGNTGAQMGGWFNKKITTIDDLYGLRMRLPGFGADVLKRAGGIPVSLPGGELFTALETGAIDATEWVGPYNDLAFGLHNAAKYYYYPGWHEPGTNLEFLINKDALQALPVDLREIIKVAARAVSQDMLDEYTFKNVQALDILLNEHDVSLKVFPDDVLLRLKQLTNELLVEKSDSDPILKKVYDSYYRFLIDVRQYGRFTENADVNID